MLGRRGAANDQVLGNGVGPVVALPLLVLDHRTLLVELGLIDRTQQVTHAVALQPQHGVERALRHRLEIVGAVIAGSAVLAGRAKLLRSEEHTSELQSLMRLSYSVFC